MLFPTPEEYTMIFKKKIFLLHSYEFQVKPKNPLGEGPASNTVAFSTESGNHITITVAFSTESSNHINQVIPNKDVKGHNVLHKELL